MKTDCETKLRVLFILPIVAVFFLGCAESENLETSTLSVTTTHVFEPWDSAEEDPQEKETDSDGVFYGSAPDQSQQDTTAQPTQADVEFASNVANLEEENPPEACSGTRYRDGDIHVTVDLSEWGMEFAFLTDPAWAPGSESPYYEWIPGKQDTLRFGPLGSSDGCSMPQYYFMQIAPQRSAAALLGELNSATWEDFEPYVESINGIEAVFYDDWGLCKHPTVQIIGVTYNYEFYPLCGNADEAQTLEQLIKTVSLTP